MELSVPGGYVRKCTTTLLLRPHLYQGFGVTNDLFHTFKQVLERMSCLTERSRINGWSTEQVTTSTDLFLDLRVRRVANFAVNMVIATC